MDKWGRRWILFETMMIGIYNYMMIGITLHQAGHADNIYNNYNHDNYNHDTGGLSCLSCIFVPAGASAWWETPWAEIQRDDNENDTWPKGFLTKKASSLLDLQYFILILLPLSKVDGWPGYDWEIPNCLQVNIRLNIKYSFGHQTLLITFKSFVSALRSSTSMQENWCRRLFGLRWVLISQESYSCIYEAAKKKFVSKEAVNLWSKPWKIICKLKWTWTLRQRIWTLRQWGSHLLLPVLAFLPSLTSTVWWAGQ